MSPDIECEKVGPRPMGLRALPLAPGEKAVKACQTYHERRGGPGAQQFLLLQMG